MNLAENLNEINKVFDIAEAVVVEMDDNINKNVIQDNKPLNELLKQDFYECRAQLKELIATCNALINSLYIGPESTPADIESFAAIITSINNSTRLLFEIYKVAISNDSNIENIKKQTDYIATNLSAVIEKIRGK